MYSTEDFIKYEFSRTDVTPELCASALTFAENNPDIDELDYNQFTELRMKVERDFSNPYNLERIEDENGKGFSIGISFHGSPTDTAWELLERYFNYNGWNKMVHIYTGVYKWHTYNKGIRTDSSSGETYKINIYHD